MPGGRGRPCGQGLHLLGRHAVGLGLAVVESGDDQILKHLLVGRRQERGVDAHALQFAFGAERETDHAAARLTFDLNAPEFLLRFLKLGLNGLRFFHHAHDIHGGGLLLKRHRRGRRRNRRNRPHRRPRPPPGTARLGTPDVDDAGPFESVKNLLHQRMRRRIARSLGLTRLRRLAQRRRGRARDKRHHPALARPFLQSSA